mmetsp:Transcript_89531/g.161491  ORF Transcript_89531/g.161491 Transcript_89531/m.161491 type:complete len:82 (+) Transcript_89531:59-304(+)
MLFFFCHLFMSPLQTTTWSNARDFKAKVKAAMSCAFFVGIVVCLGREAGIMMRFLAANALSDTICFSLYLKLRTKNAKAMW